MKQVISRFTKGINKRLSPSERDDPERLYTVLNARLQSRGQSRDITRIKGCLELVSTEFDNVYDIEFFDKNGTPVLLFTHNTVGNTFSVKEILVDSPHTVTEIGTYDTTEATKDNTELLVLEDTVFISPVNKQLNFINGTWYLNDFKSTTPLFTTSVTGGSLATGVIQVLGDAGNNGTPAVAHISGFNVVADSPPQGGYYILDIGGNTVSFLVVDGDTPNDVRDIIILQINSDPTLSTLYTATSGGDAFVVITSRTNGSALNGITPTISFNSGDHILFVDTISAFFGGSDGGVLGSIVFGIVNATYNKRYIIATPPINSNETRNEIADKISTAINISTDSDYTAIPLAFGSVSITSREKGSEYNGVINILSNPTGANISITNLTGGSDVGGDLKENVTYHYKARYVYFDGHKTATCYPVIWKTTFGVRQVTLEFIDIPADLDNNYPDIEIFRREEGGDWFLIDRVTPTDTTYSYTDDGKVERGLLDEQSYVWSETHQTHEFVRDRYVRANVNYPIRSISDSDSFTVSKVPVTQLQNEQDILPPNTNIDVYAQARYNDGLTSFHKRVGSVHVGDEQATLTVSGSVTGAKETAYFAKFQPTSDETAVIPFNSVEIYNQNVPSIATKDEVETAQDKPINPHVFLGFKYIAVGAIGENYNIYNGVLYSVYDSDWNTNPQPDAINNNRVILNPVITVPDGYAVENGFPELIDITVKQKDNLTTFSQKLTYRLKHLSTKVVYYELDPEITNGEVYYVKSPCAIYEIAFLDALKEAVRQGKASVEMVSSSKNLSSKRPNTEFYGLDVNVVGVLDTSETEQEIVSVNEQWLYNTSKNHIYLVLQTGTPFDDFDNPLANNNGVKVQLDGSGATIPDYTATYSFRLKNVRETDFGGDTTISIQNPGESTEYETHTQDYGITSTLGLKDEIDSLIYLGTSPNVNNLGFVAEKTNKFLFYKLKPSNVYNQLIEESDLQLLQSEYPNQIIWSESYMRGSNSSGIRNFTFSNFLNIDRAYGKIVSLVSVVSDLLVLCERGVAKINVGEVVTQQISGQVVVDSSSLLNGYYFILRNLVDVKPKSVVKYENVVFFGDGLDIWMYDGGLKNITNGSIVLDKNSRWSATFDPYNKEYIVTDGALTYAYSLEFGEWYQYSYIPTIGTFHKTNMYNIIGNKICVHNTGNTFNGTEYDTVIESVVNDLQAPHDVKLYRKFYIESDNPVTLKYGKEYGNWQTKLFSDLVSKNGQYHAGIVSSEKNSTKLFWRVESNKENFNIRSLAFEFSVRKRR